MGLPFFVTPVELDVAAKAVEKTAAAARSAIRRQPTQSGNNALIDYHRQMRAREMRLAASGQDPYPSRGWSAFPPRAGDLSASAAATERRGYTGDAARDLLGFDYHARRNQQEQPSMPPVPESRDFTTADLDLSTTEEGMMDIQRLRLARHRLRRTARRHPAPTPPYTNEEVIGYSPVTTMMSYTSLDQAPRTRSYASQEPSATGAARRSLEEEIQDSSLPHPVNPVGRPSLSERVQTMTRLSAGIERSQRLIRQARLDGLGDRDRSLSPEGGAAWDTLSTGIALDPQPPSAGSSFASTSAAAVATSSSSSTDQTTASTALTSIGSVEDPLNDCELSDENTTDDEEEDMFELHDFNRARNDRLWRSYPDVFSARADHLARHSANTSAGEADHLGGMHRIISRLAERDDIPDEWWAGAGLSRNLRRERTDTS